MRGFFFPRSNTAPPGVTAGKVEIDLKQLAERFALCAAGGEKGQARQSSQRRTVVLRPRPAHNIERAVRIETRFAEQFVAAHLAQLLSRAQELTKAGPRMLPRAAVEIGARQSCQRQTETDEVFEMRLPSSALAGRSGIAHEFGHGAHDNRRITDPVVKIVRLRLPVPDRN